MSIKFTVIGKIIFFQKFNILNTMIIVTKLIISPYNPIKVIKEKDKRKVHLMAIVASCHYQNVHKLFSCSFK